MTPNGPNVTKLIAHKMSLDAFPPGTRDGLISGLRFILDKERWAASAKAASEWVQMALHLLRTAADPNPWKTADDETIAEELLRQIEERKKAS